MSDGEVSEDEIVNAIRALRNAPQTVFRLRISRARYEDCRRTFNLSQEFMDAHFDVMWDKIPE